MAERFTRFTAKYCLNEIIDDICYLEYGIFGDLNRPLSPKFPDKDGLSI